MHKDGITVAEYWTELPPKAELERQLRAALAEARERLENKRRRSFDSGLLSGHVSPQSARE